MQVTYKQKNRIWKVNVLTPNIMRWTNLGIAMSALGANLIFYAHYWLNAICSITHGNQYLQQPYAAANCVIYQLS